jgi:hypothetical protein
MSGHTPGPWDSSVTKQGIIVLGERVPVTPDQVKRFGCDPCSVVAPTICTVAIGNPNRESDAALILAAPALLAACKAALATLEGLDLQGRVLWIEPPHQAAAVHETVHERLMAVIQEAEGCTESPALRRGER